MYQQEDALKKQQKKRIKTETNKNHNCKIISPLEKVSNDGNL